MSYTYSLLRHKAVALNPTPPSSPPRVYLLSLIRTRVPSSTPISAPHCTQPSQTLLPPDPALLTTAPPLTVSVSCTAYDTLPYSPSHMIILVSFHVLGERPHPDVLTPANQRAILGPVATQ